MTPQEVADTLRSRTCLMGANDHGHTDCALYGIAADLIEELAEQRDRLLHDRGVGNE